MRLSAIISGATVDRDPVAAAANDQAFAARVERDDRRPAPRHARNLVPVD